VEENNKPKKKPGEVEAPAKNKTSDRKNIRGSGKIEKYKVDNVADFCALFHLAQIGLLRIKPSGGPPIGETFHPTKDKLKIQKWIKENENNNIYFSVNPTKNFVTSKVEKIGIASMNWLHVDIDPKPEANPNWDPKRKGEPEYLPLSNEYNKRWKSEKLKQINALHTKPSLIIDSGGGLNVYWRIKPVPIKGEEEWTQLELYLKQLVIDLDGDSAAAEISRILRMPFTTNFPSEKKIKNGREPNPTKVIEFNDLIYTLRDFKKANPKNLKSKESKKQKSNPVNLSHLGIDQSYQQLILNGFIEDEPDKYMSDSEAVFAATCVLLQRGIDDEIIHSILLDKRFKISEHNYRQPNSDCYAQKQIKNAKEQIKENLKSIDESIEALTEDSREAEIKEIFENVIKAQFSKFDIDLTIKKIRRKTKTPVSILREIIKEIKIYGKISEDIGLKVAIKTLNKYFEGRKYLIRTKEGSSWEYKETHWEQTNDDFIKNRIIKTIESEQKKNADFLDGNNFDSITRQALNLIKALQVMDGDPLCLMEVPKPIINVKNGELWLDENGNVELRDHSYDSYLTYCLNVEYEPDAKCTEYDKALLNTFKNVRGGTEPKEMASLWNEIMGYIIQPNRDIPAYFILYGNGCNGKTSLVEVMTNLVGKNSIHAGRIDKLESGNLFMIGSLAGKLLFLDDDVNANTKLPDGILKKISERKIMTGEHKFKDHFDFVCVAVPVLLCNQYPNTSDLTHGMLRRAYVLPFDRRFTEKDIDPTLFPSIKKNELPGVLNRALEGLKRLRQKGQFNIPKACKVEKKKWLVAANPLMSFIDEQCNQGSYNDDTGEFSGLDKNGEPLSQELCVFFQRYTSWCDNGGIKNPITKRTLKRNLESLGYLIHKSSLNRIMGLEAQKDDNF